MADWIDELKRLEAAATPAPWEACAGSVVSPDVSAFDFEWQGTGECGNDGEFIIALRNHARYLIAAAERCEELEAERELYEGMREGFAVRIADSEKRCRELEAIVDRLPKTADGVPIVPDMQVWVYSLYCQEPLSRYWVMTIETELNGNWWCHLRDEHGAQGGTEPCDLYSTSEAAEAAKKGGA